MESGERNLNIWGEDRLGRKADADYLKSFLLQRNELAVARGDRGTSLNINAPWGAGKTFFLNRFAKQLKQDGYNVAEVNAWKDDHAEDPMLAVVSAVLSALTAGKDTKFANKIKTLIGKVFIKAVIGATKKGANSIFGHENVVELSDLIKSGLVSAGEEMLVEYGTQALKHFEDQQKTIGEFREILERNVKNKKPLFVLVDELDRCRPTYAISMLERVKHFFDVPNVIFVFGTNGDQLSHTIRAVYGAGFAAEMYLKRFFDRTYEFDAPALSDFVSQYWNELQLETRSYVTSPGVDHVEFISAFSAEKRLSLRDTQQCMELLWGVCIGLGADLRIPLLYVYPVLVAYHLQASDIFSIACGETRWDGVRKSPFGLFFNYDPIVPERVQGRQTGSGALADSSLHEIVQEFIRLINDGLGSNPESSSAAGRYVDNYRYGEFEARNQPLQNVGATKSVLASFGSIVRRAGRILPQPSGT